MVKFKKIFAVSIAVFALILCGLFQSVSISYAASEQVISGGDGTYTVPVNLDLKMGADNFTNPVTVEKFGGKYYMTFGFSSSIGYLNLNLDGKEVGKTSEKKDGWTYYTYTLSENNLKSKLSFSAYINAMSREMSFTATLNLSSSEKTSETVRDLGERPAEFVPVISTKAAAEYSLKVGTVFPIPEATIARSRPRRITATRRSMCRVKNLFSAKSERISWSIRRLTRNIRHHRVTIRSRNTLLRFVPRRAKTILLNSEMQITFCPKKRESSRENLRSARKFTKKNADNFEVYSAEFLSEDGEVITLSGKVELLFRADDYFDRTKAEVYYMDDNGSLTKLSASGYGRYVVTATDKTGTFIVCIPGVAFHMPMWGYALILVGAVVILAGVVVTIIVVVKRKKRMMNS